MNRKHIWAAALAVYCLCFVLRVIEYFCIRTDATVIGEAVIHKTLGIIILFVAAKLLSFTPQEIGFRKDGAAAKLLAGFCLGLCCYALSYGTEVFLMKRSGAFERLGLFVTSYSVDGNLGMRTGLLFFAVCIIGNIINVVMEEGVFRGLLQKLFERRYRFFASAVFASVLFGLWHCVGPVRSFADGASGMNQLVVNLIILVGSSFLVGLKYAMLAKLTGSLYAGMADHFVNNTIVNILHVVGSSGIDQLQTVRISIAQSVSFIIVLVLYLRRKK